MRSHIKHILWLSAIILVVTACCLLKVEQWRANRRCRRLLNVCYIAELLLENPERRFRSFDEFRDYVREYEPEVVAPRGAPNPFPGYMSGGIAYEHLEDFPTEPERCDVPVLWEKEPDREGEVWVLFLDGSSRKLFAETLKVMIRRLRR